MMLLVRLEAIEANGRNLRSYFCLLRTFLITTKLNGKNYYANLLLNEVAVN